MASGHFPARPADYQLELVAVPQVVSQFLSSSLMPTSLASSAIRMTP